MSESYRDIMVNKNVYTKQLYSLYNSYRYRL